MFEILPVEMFIKVFSSIRIFPPAIGEILHRFISKVATTETQ
mgnify:CR=1 FL=1